uniref:Estradiol 17-beta-dehydrogenase 12 n=1 Tax=Mesocestoides corti TaxID=53468 RepID=A0A5K3G2I3_MESCO
YLEKQYNVRTKIFVADCTKEDFYDELQRELTCLSSISCLINNVGMTYIHPDDLVTSDFLTLAFCQDIITVNATTLTKITRLALPKMVNDPLPTRDVHRYVINIGSFTGLFVFPYAAVYSASKAYVHSFTQ